MILNIDGDILTADVDIIAHQTNCKGIMGAGVAKQIADKYPSILSDYINTCNTYKDNCLGNILFTKPKECPTLYIANMFGQNDYGIGDKVYTDIEALKKCFISLINIKDDPNLSFTNKAIIKIAIPYKIGCCRGGEDWDKVYSIIHKAFSKLNNIELQIWKYNK